VGGARPEKADVRVVAATKRDLREQVAQRLFRDDLMYRLNVVTLRIPPLRERSSDIPELAGFFLRCAMARFGRGPKKLTDETLSLLTTYTWPGNVRELEHVIDSVVIMHAGTEIRPADLAQMLRMQRDYPLFSLNTEGQESISLEQVLLDFERALLTWAFEKAEQNQGRAAKLLGIPRSTFQYRWSAAVERPSAAETQRLKREAAAEPDTR
ncbi:MAG: sigma 54-interacting transcriptional regulator, partial [Planctomycetota bacterium]|nr:sigma 54-interacting transcriptional regulator [Planctomycetota bacterium]